MSNIGYVYKIVCNITNEIYVGSTKTKKLSQRLAGHICSFKTYLKGKGNMCSSYQIIARGDYGIHLLETVEYNTIYELRVRERYHFELCDCVNKRCPIIFEEEVGEYNQKYYKEHRDEMKEYIQVYRKENCDKIKKANQEYCEKNRDKIKEHRKEYCEKNRDKIKEKSQKYYEKNREEILKKMKERNNNKKMILL